MPLSTMFQLYRGGQVFVEETGVPRKHHRPVASHVQALSHNILYRVDLVWAEFELLMLVVIGTDCIGRYKSNYHSIMTMMAPY